MSKPEDSGLERDYCAGLLSLRDMAEIYGISEGAIRKRAKKNGWVRNKPEGTQKSTQVRKTGTQKKEVRTVEKKAVKEIKKILSRILNLQHKYYSMPRNSGSTSSREFLLKILRWGKHA
ncbi:TPA: hypothetical protein RFN18_002605 [Klebsiella aerogenes]|nr:hypothetical protein [Klebsiella aerogenes]HDU4085878.1 hypothetical protein [Klebsiella aerogenes]